MKATKLAVGSLGMLALCLFAFGGSIQAEPSSSNAASAEVVGAAQSLVPVPPRGGETCGHEASAGLTIQESSCEGLLSCLAKDGTSCFIPGQIGYCDFYEGYCATCYCNGGTWECPDQTN